MIICIQQLTTWWRCEFRMDLLCQSPNSSKPTDSCICCNIRIQVLWWLTILKRDKIWTFSKMAHDNVINLIHLPCCMPSGRPEISQHVNIILNIIDYIYVTSCRNTVWLKTFTDQPQHKKHLHNIVKVPLMQPKIAVMHWGMDFTRALNMSCGFWHQDISRIFYKLWGGIGFMGPALLDAQSNWDLGNMEAKETASTRSCSSKHSYIILAVWQVHYPLPLRNKHYYHEEIYVVCNDH